VSGWSIRPPQARDVAGANLVCSYYISPPGLGSGLSRGTSKTVDIFSAGSMEAVMAGRDPYWIVSITDLFGILRPHGKAENRDGPEM
jgi:hypothetical protein